MRRMAATDFDLDAYLHRIAFTGPREPTLAVLRRALLALGFDVMSLAARVVWMAPPDLPVRPRTHMLLLVTVPGDATRPRLVDAGFGGHLINVPLRLQAGL